MYNYANYIIKYLEICHPTNHVYIFPTKRPIPIQYPRYLYVICMLSLCYLYVIFMFFFMLSLCYLYVLLYVISMLSLCFLYVLLYVIFMLSLCYLYVIFMFFFMLSLCYLYVIFMFFFMLSLCYLYVLQNKLIVGNSLFHTVNITLRHHLRWYHTLQVKFDLLV